MPVKVFENRLMLGVIGAVLLYWGPGLLLPRPFISAVVSLSLLVFGGLTFATYLHPTYDVLFQRKRDEMERGSHLHILGTFLISSGLVWSGIYGIAWVMAGQPYGWSGTLTSNFGRAMLGTGMLLSYIAPQTTETGIVMKARIWVWGAVGVAFAAGFLLATQINYADDTARFMNSTAKNCPSDMPVWGSVKGKYYMPGSPYRGLVKPVRCFASEQEAKDAGFTLAE